MNKKQRIQAAINGEKPDKMPYSFWSHMPGTDLDPEAISDKTLEFYKKFDFDFIKTMNNGMYAIEDFGATVDYSGIAKGGIAKIISTPVSTPEQIRKLQPCSYEKGSLARELRHLQLVLDKVKGENVPVIFTVFSPLTILDKLIGGERGSIRQFMEDGHGAELKKGLEAIAETTAALSAKAIDMGADGVFFASQLSSYDFMTAEQYKEFGVPFDLEALKGAEKGWMNTIHCHGTNIMFELLKDYPIQVFNWHAWESLPDLAEAQALSGKCLMGGLDRRDITAMNKPAVQHQIYECFRQLKGRNIILTPGCVIRYPLNEEMLAYIGEARDLVENAFEQGRIS